VFGRALPKGLLRRRWNCFGGATIYDSTKMALRTAPPEESEPKPRRSPTKQTFNQELVAHVGDFGIAKILFHSESDKLINSNNTIGIRGTIGYGTPGNSNLNILVRKKYKNLLMNDVCLRNCRIYG
jgi:hypothetical protein